MKHDKVVICCSIRITLPARRRHQAKIIVDRITALLLYTAGLLPYIKDADKKVTSYLRCLRS